MIPRFRIAGVALIFVIFATTLFHGPFSLRERLTGGTADAPPATHGLDEGKASEDPPPEPLPDACPDHLDWLRDELADSPDIRFPLRYARRDIIVRPTAGLERASVTNVNECLLPDFQEISSPDGCELKEEQRLPSLYLEVPSFSTHVDASHILFGASTTLDRLDASIPFFQRWLANTGARMIVIVIGNDDATPDPQAMEDLQNRMRELGMLMTLIKPLNKKDNGIERVFSLIRVLHENRDESTKWFGLIDDDTFFTSMSALVSRLAEFDPQKRWYLGAVSEEWWTVVLYGWIAMGWLRRHIERSNH